MKLAVCTVVPLIVMSPVIAVVLPTAVVLCPNKISGTRYCAALPDFTFHVAVNRVRARVAGRRVGLRIGGDRRQLQLRGRIALDEVDVDERAPTNTTISRIGIPMNQVFLLRMTEPNDMGAS